MMTAGPRGRGAGGQHEQLTFPGVPPLHMVERGTGGEVKTGLPILGVADGRAVTFEAVPTRSVLNSPTATHMPFWSVNPYIGCEFGCTYCYARDTHRWTMERTEGARTSPLSVIRRGGQGVRTAWRGGQGVRCGERDSG